MLLSLDAVILLATCAGLIRHGLAAQATISYVAAELCLLALFAAVRREIILEGSFAWSYVHDVWAEILAALALAGLKELVRLPREGALPVVLSLFLLLCLGLRGLVAVRCSRYVRDSVLRNVREDCGEKFFAKQHAY